MLLLLSLVVPLGRASTPRKSMARVILGGEVEGVADDRAAGCLNRAILTWFDYHNGHHESKSSEAAGADTWLPCR